MIKKDHGKAKWLHGFKIYAKSSLSNICIIFKQMKISNILVPKKVAFSFVIYFAACLFVSTLKGQSDSTSYCPMAIEGASWVVFDNEGRYRPYTYDSYVMRISSTHQFEKLLDLAINKSDIIISYNYTIGTNQLKSEK